MTIGSKEHYEIIAMFDKEFKHLRLDKEDKADWSKGRVYQNGEVNNLYKVYFAGFAFAKSIYQ